MPRRRRQEGPTGIYHWITRGHQKKDIFHFKVDFVFFLSLVDEYRRAYSIVIYHYCLLNNHLHLLIKAQDAQSTSLFSHFVKRRYAYYHSKQYKHMGNTFEKRYGSIPVEDERHLLECGRYIERNPLRAGLTRHPGDYPYSSFNFYAKGTDNPLITMSPAYEGLSDDPEVRGKMYTGFVVETRPQEEYAQNTMSDF